MQTIREINVEIFMPNFAVLRTAVFPLFTKENAVFAIARNVDRRRSCTSIVQRLAARWSPPDRSVSRRPAE